MTTAKFVTEVIVTDPDSKLPVEVSIYKHQNGGLFGLDSSFIDQTFEEDEPIVYDIFEDHTTGPKVKLIS